MDSVFSTVIPVFSLIALGFIAGRLRWVSENVTKGLAEFIFTLAVPALLFRTMATADLPDVSPVLVWSTYFATVFVAWSAATLLTITLLRRPAADSAPIAMSSGFGNVVMLGIPLALATFGEAAAGPIALIISVHSPVLWTLASVHLAVTDRGNSASMGETLKGVARDLSRNTIILAILAGTLWRFTGIGLNPVVEKSMALLGQAAIPSALVSLGLSLVGFQIKGQAMTLTTILILKLICMPLVAWIIAFHVLALPPVAAGVVVIFAATPTGANAYLFANQYGRAMNSASGAVALGTALSLVTASVLLANL